MKHSPSAFDTSRRVIVFSQNLKVFEIRFSILLVNFSIIKLQHHEQIHIGNLISNEKDVS